MFFSSFPTCLSGYSLERCQFVDGEAEMKDSHCFPTPLQSSLASGSQTQNTLVESGHPTCIFFSKVGNSEILCLHSSVFHKIWEKIEFSRHFAVLHILKMSFHPGSPPHPNLLSSSPFFGGAFFDWAWDNLTDGLPFSLCAFTDVFWLPDAANVR